MKIGHVEENSGGRTEITAVQQPKVPEANTDILGPKQCISKTITVLLIHNPVQNIKTTIFYI